MLRIGTVVGARPQFIKASVVSRAIGSWNRGSGEELAEFIIHTGQHYDADMSGVFFSELQIPRPAANLNVGSSSHAVQTGAMLLGLEKLFAEMKLDVVLVYGDTNSTLAAAIVAAKMGIPLAHVEAGLRSGNRAMPEEINRITADRLSTVLFTATKAAVGHLACEGLSDRVHVVGDVMLDCVRIYGNASSRTAGVLNRFGLQGRQYCLATIHRAENTDDPAKLVEIFIGLSRAAENLPVVLPIYPRTASVVRRHVPESALGKIAIMEPAGFLDMMTLEAGASVIATDSGGVQKEAYFHGVPCVTIREETEWVETVESGWNVLSPANADSVLANIQKMAGFDRGIPRPAYYGDGYAADKIVACLAGRSYL